MILLRKCLVTVLGGTLLVAGVAMLVLPGPAVVVIAAALAILAIEFLWARRWLAWLRERFKTISPKRPAKWCRTCAEMGMRVTAQVASRASAPIVSRE